MDDVIFGHGLICGSLFKIGLFEYFFSSNFVIDCNMTISSSIGHARLGHIGKDRMAKLARQRLLGPLTKFDLPICELYLAGKACRKPFGKAVRDT